MSASKRAEPVSIHGSRAKASSVLMQWAQVCVRSILLLVSQGNFSVFIWDPGVMRRTAWRQAVFQGVENVSNNTRKTSEVHQH
jgi:hypothetical protein